MRHRPKPSASGSSTSASVSRRTSVPVRSEEHTSELQSQSNLVCRLLLEKKNKNSSHSQMSYSALSLKTKHPVPHALFGWTLMTHTGHMWDWSTSLHPRAAMGMLSSTAAE